MSENQIQNLNNKKVTYLKYPILAKCCASGHTNQYSVSYNPIYANPSKRLLKHNWKVTKLDYASLLYTKINSLCNLYSFQEFRHILFIDCRTFNNPTKEEILNFIQFKKNTENIVYDKETARCYMLADQIFLNTRLRTKYDPAYAYTFKYYIPEEDWKYFYMSPIPMCVFDAICTEIHKSFSLYYTLISFGLDINSYPFMEVLISNVPRIQKPSIYQYLSRDNSTMDYSKGKLIQDFNAGKILGAHKSLNILDSKEYHFKPVNDVETYRKLLIPNAQC